MSHVHVNMGASGSAVLENYTLGDVLICKAHRGKLQEVKCLIEEVNAEVNYRNQNGCTALHGAAASGQLSLVQYMLESTVINPSAVDDEDQTALHYAAFYGHLEVVQLLVEHGVPLDIPDKYGRLAHCSAAINGHLDVVTYLLEECPDPIDINAIDEYGGTCVHWAASKGRKEVVQYLCLKGIDVHVTSYDNKSAYQLAKDKQKHKCVQFLKSWYETSQKYVHAAEEGNDEEIRRITNEINGAFPLRYMRDKNGKNAMHWAAEQGHLSTLKLLGEHFVVWTDADKFGRNALHCAALGGHKDCAFWLIRNAKDASQFLSLTLTNKTPSRCAFEAGHSAVAARLQAWEEGNDEYSKIESDIGHSSSHISFHDDDAIRTRDVDTVRSWLKTVNMDEYTENFKNDGFDTLRRVATINEVDLIDMKVKKGHRRDALSHIEELQSQLAALDESSIHGGRELDSSPTLDMLPTLNKSTAHSQGTNTFNRDVDTVRSWLKTVNMDEYTENFKNYGFDTLRRVATINEVDLIDMQVKKGHRRVALSHIEELQSQLAALDELSIHGGRELDSSPTLDMLPTLNRSTAHSQGTNSFNFERSDSNLRLERPGSFLGE